MTFWLRGFSPPLPQELHRLAMGLALLPQGAAEGEGLLVPWCDGITVGMGLDLRQPLVTQVSQGQPPGFRGKRPTGPKVTFFTKKRNSLKAPRLLGRKGSRAPTLGWLCPDTYGSPLIGLPLPVSGLTRSVVGQSFRCRIPLYRSRLL